MTLATVALQGLQSLSHLLFGTELAPAEATWTPSATGDMPKTTCE